MIKEEAFRNFIRTHHLSDRWDEFCHENRVKGISVEEDLKRVYITQDDDGHNYVIPYEMKDDFIIELDLISSLFGVDGFELQEKFNDKFSQYATGGDINLIELYARI